MGTGGSYVILYYKETNWSPAGGTNISQSLCVQAGAQMFCILFSLHNNPLRWVVYYSYLQIRKLRHREKNLSKITFTVSGGSIMAQEHLHFWNVTITPFKLQNSVAHIRIRIIGLVFHTVVIVKRCGNGDNHQRREQIRDKWY